MTVGFMKVAGVSMISACLMVWGSACATTSSSEAVAPDYAARVQARIALERASDRVLVRYNPTPCNCPAFEILLDGRWHRVAFDKDDNEAIVSALTNAISSPDAATRTYTLRGSLSDRLMTCGKGAIFVTLTPTEWVDAPGAGL